MPTGACGINCDVCRLNLLEICSTCGPGTSREAAAKIEAQERLFGIPCPILACARMNRIQYCLRDCRSFPCGNFEAGSYPFSEGFLRMQERRRKQVPPARSPRGDLVRVPPEHWDELPKKDLDEVCKNSMAAPLGPEGVQIRFLNEELRVDFRDRCLRRFDGEHWEQVDHPLLELVVLVYLLNAAPAAVSDEMISAKDLKDAHFFQGPHALKTGSVLKRFGRDPEGFKRASEGLSGEPLDLADVAYRFLPFPKIPLYYLLWEGDEEFEPNLSILFDRSIERHLSADAIWGLVNLVSTALVAGG